MIFPIVVLGGKKKDFDSQTVEHTFRMGSMRTLVNIHVNIEKPHIRNTVQKKDTRAQERNFPATRHTLIVNIVNTVNCDTKTSDPTPNTKNMQ